MALRMPVDASQPSWQAVAAGESAAAKSHQSHRQCWSEWHRGCTEEKGPGVDVKLTACGGVQALHPYHVRVLVPTYKETLEIVAKTVHAAYNAPLPYGCLRTIYVCDDGKDGSKRKW